MHTMDIFAFGSRAAVYGSVFMLVPPNIFYYDHSRLAYFMLYQLGLSSSFQNYFP